MLIMYNYDFECFEDVKESVNVNLKDGFQVAKQAVLDGIMVIWESQKAKMRP